MANISDVFMKIRYRKNGKFCNDDLLKDKDIFNFLNDTSYPGGDDERKILPQNKEKLIFRTYGRWNYWNRFDFENTDCIEILSNICSENENTVIRNEKISLEKKSFFEKLKKIINNIKKS